MHPFGSLTKRCTVSVRKRNERTQSTFLDPIVMFWFVLASFVTMRETMPGLHLMHRFGPFTKRCTVSVQKRNERTQSTFLDPIVMFWFVLASFVTVRETMPGLHLIHRFGPLTKRCTVLVQKRNKRTQSTFLDPIVMFWFVLVSFVTMKNHANVAFNAPIRVINETMHSFDPETKRTCPIHVFGPNTDVFVRFGKFHYYAKNHANVAFNAPIRVVNETMHSFDPET